MVRRIYVERRPGLDTEARALLEELRNIHGIRSLSGLRMLNRYDAEGMDAGLFARCVPTVFSEPQTDIASESMDAGDGLVFAVEFLPGQFDQRADSAAQCVQFISMGQRPRIRSARVYVLYGALSGEEIAAVKKHVINPVECREASLEPYDTLENPCEIPETVAVLEGFRSLEREELDALRRRLGLAMDINDLLFSRSYFREEGRDPSMTELRVLDTYWSDHCRHSTFHTILDAVTFDDPEIEAGWQEYLRCREELGRTKDICLMDVGTLAARVLKARGQLTKLDESDEINACTVKITVTVDGREEPWLLLFKNETHNHPTEIEPFGGAATCIGGAIRDPLSGRAYVYAAMRLTGAADPRTPVSETLPGKLPQRSIVTRAAAGYSSYGNQIGLCTGMVDEIYHPGYAAKRMEIGAVVGAVPAAQVRREEPAAGDIVILLGGRTGRDGCGGATGSSKSHTAASLDSCGAEVQKGNAPEERKLQRLFRNAEACRLIKRCNDFGAGGVSVAIGEIARGLEIDLNAVPRKYDGLDGTELAISESQERMAVAVEAGDAARFLELARSENLEATVVARVTDSERLRMQWNGRYIVDLSRRFLDSNGAERHTTVHVLKGERWEPTLPASFADGLRKLSADLNVCSRRGLAERFDASIGAGTVLMPFGGRRQLTPLQAMAHTISLEKGRTDDCSLMSWGFDAAISEKSPYRGAYLAVLSSLAKLAAAGASLQDCYLSFQEYFRRMEKPEHWGEPLSALLGALRAQLELGAAAIGGKDSMSGSFEDIHVPPTLVSFAVTTEKADKILSPEFKKAGHSVCWLPCRTGADGLPDAEAFKALCARLYTLPRAAVYTPGRFGIAEAVLKMCFGNHLGFRFAEGQSLEKLFSPAFGGFVVECEGPCEGELLGTVTEEPAIVCGGESVSLDELLTLWEGTLESVYPCRVSRPAEPCPTVSFEAERRPAPRRGCAAPRALIPVFPGTNCEYDSARALRDAGVEPEIFLVNNLSPEAVAESIAGFAKRMAQSQIVFLPGGFSGGDEPDGSGKFITAFFRSPAVREAVHELLHERDGLMGGICNGFQALIKLGLIPYGEIRDMDEHCPTLTFNTIGRHQSRLVRTRVASSLSPWLMETRVGEVYTVPISHGEGRLVAEESLLRELADRGQIITQYVDDKDEPSGDILYNPNGSAWAIEGLCSPDGRVFGKMGHSERIGDCLYRNVPGRYDMGLFRSAARYFR